ncbi:hypothetical protein ACFVHR_04695 [Streptomyces sp. NPDC127168]|uniref:hypothetical protein n=1 Tax=unclassified Streptomyces TaxID=2593676 RepID=UPI00363E3856
MTYHHRDRDGDRLEVRPGTDAIKLDALDATTLHRVILTIPLDRIEELVAGIRDTARQARRGSNPHHIGNRANAEDCPACWGTNPPYPFLCPGGTS